MAALYDGEDGMKISVRSLSAKSPQDLEAEIAATAAALGGPPAPTFNKTPTSTTRISATKKTPAAPKSPPKLEIKKRKAISYGVPESPSQPKPKTLDDKPPVTSSGMTAKKIAPKSAVKSTKPLKTTPKSVNSEDIIPVRIVSSTKKTDNETIMDHELAITLGYEPDNILDDIVQLDDHMFESDTPDTADVPDVPDFQGALQDEGVQDYSFDDKEIEALMGRQNPPIFDTKQYHLPLEPNRHHRKSTLPIWAQALVVAFAAAGSLTYAITTGIISINPDRDSNGEPAQFIDIRY